MRRRTALAFAGVLTISPAGGQERTPILTSLLAKDHLGELATVCGQVTEYSCQRNTPFMTLTFAPAPNSFRVKVAETDRERFGRRLEDQFFGQIICVRGTIEKDADRFQITVPDPTHLDLQKQDRIEPPPRLAPDAHSACDPGVALPVVLRDVKPQYTPGAMRDRAQGAVLVRAVVQADGTVGDMQIVRSLHPELDMEAARTTKQWRFRPGTYMGKPVPVIVVVEMTFTLRNR